MVIGDFGADSADLAKRLNLHLQMNPNGLFEIVQFSDSVATFYVECCNNYYKTVEIEFNVTGYTTRENVTYLSSDAAAETVIERKFDEKMGCEVITNRSNGIGWETVSHYIQPKDVEYPAQIFKCKDPKGFLRKKFFGK
jgi:hypothetical protein